MVNWTKSTWAPFALLGALAFLPYWRSFNYPFISDDYIQIRLSRILGAPENWEQLLKEPLYRCRATSLYLTAATERLFGLVPAAYNASSLLLHALNTYLVLALFVALGVTPLAAFAGAGFFAVYEGHQEAVVWYAACPELLVLAFSLGAILCWRRWSEAATGGWPWYGAALALFILALFSKESGVVVAPLLLLLCWWRGKCAWKRAIRGAAPFAALAAVYAAIILASRDQHQFFSDGTFSLTPQFLAVLPHSMGRMLLFWGALAVVVLGRCRTLLLGLAWMGVTLLPYSFLTYMSRAPSRHTYFASVGLSLLVGAALAVLREKSRSGRPWLAPVLASTMVVHNCFYLWTRKHEQYLERAAPTEQLLEHIRSHRQYRGPVWVVNFPYDKYVVECALAVATERDPNKLFVTDRAPDRSVHFLEWDDNQKQLIAN